MMFLFLFADIGFVSGLYGLTEAVSAGINLKNAKEVNERANELINNIATEDGVQKMLFELDPIMPVLKRGVLTGIKMGILAAIGACGMAGILAAAGRILAACLGNPAEQFTILMILGNGSLAVEMAVLAGIIAGIFGAVLGTQVQKRAKINYEKAYSNLFRAKEIVRKRRWEQDVSMEYLTAFSDK